MAMNVIMPQLGETVSEGTVSVWHAEVGDKVSPKTPLFDVSSDKVEMEVPAPGQNLSYSIPMGVPLRRRFALPMTPSRLL